MTISSLNQDCHCTTLQAEPLQQAWRERIGSDVPVGTYFAPYGVFLSAAQEQALLAAVHALHRVTRQPAVVAAVAATQGEGLPHSRTDGVLMGYDFHFDGDTPRLIEINTNAGGALLNALLLAHQQICCGGLKNSFLSALGDDDPGAIFLDMFRREWHLAGRDGEPRRVAIVDENPEAQFLYPEFLLFRKLFESAGWEAVICAPESLQREGGRLLAAGRPVDLVYNRLTDFALLEPAQARLREAWLADECVVTPDPWHHALHADKRNLVHLSDAAWLTRMGVPPADRELLARIVPATQPVTADTADELWSARKQFFFKPSRGYGSKAAYRGDKLTRGVWADIVASHDYVAQAYAPPGTRRVEVEGEIREMKFDVRAYAYAGEVLLLAARVYQGQTTNMRTAGGGFAPVFVPERALTCPA
jgi:hypothetical protein